MFRLHLCLTALLFVLLSGCNEPQGRAGGDDDDSARADDDSATLDDDDDSSGKPDDDDTSGDDDDASDDDDNDHNDDDDDSAAVDPGLGFVNRSYCLEWDSMNFQSPAGLVGMLGALGVNLNDFPLLLSPTGVAIPVEEILMLLAAAAPGTCTQDPNLSTYNLTAAQAGHYLAPHFAVGPSDISITTPVATLVLYNAVFEGDFTADSSQVIRGAITGRLDVSAYSGYCSALGWTCTPCPTGFGTCVDLITSDASWNDSGAGPLIPTP